MTKRQEPHRSSSQEESGKRIYPQDEGRAPGWERV